MSSYLAGLPEPAYDASGPPCRDRIYVVGGRTRDGTVLGAVRALIQP